MKYQVKELERYKILAKDGEIGKTEDFYFEDTNWMLRYLVVETGTLLGERQVLLSPYVLREPDRDLRIIPVNLTMHQVAESPDPGSERPVSLQHEHALHAYYGWPIYWGYPGVFPGFIPVPPRDLEIPMEELHTNPHLRSFGEIEGYHIRTGSGDAGHVEDMILDTETWSFPYLVVNTGGLFSGKKGLLGVEWVTGIEYPDREIRVRVSRELIRESPEYDPSVPLEPDFEHRLRDYYGQVARSI